MTVRMDRVPPQRADAGGIESAAWRVVAAFNGRPVAFANLPARCRNSLLSLAEELGMVVGEAAPAKEPWGLRLVGGSDEA